MLFVARFWWERLLLAESRSSTDGDWAIDSVMIDGIAKGKGDAGLMDASSAGGCCMERTLVLSNVVA